MSAPLVAFFSGATFFLAVLFDFVCSLLVFLLLARAVTSRSLPPDL